MKEYRNRDEWESQDEPSESRALVPYIEILNEDEAPQRRTRRVWIIVCACVVITVTLLTLALKNATPKALQNPVEVPTDVSTDEEWRGAFAARNIYEQCYENAVTVRVGHSSESPYWSGFVIDTDGWIATSLEIMTPSARGKIYVSFNDGREYSVDSVICDNEYGIALLKIRAESLNAVQLREGELHLGERIIGVGALEYGRSCVLSGEICGTLDDSLKINIGLDEHGTGAPLFDEDGYLVGMATSRDFQDGGKISCALTAYKCRESLEKVK